MPSALFFFLRISLVILGLRFHIRITCPTSVKNDMGDLIEITLYLRLLWAV